MDTYLKKLELHGFKSFPEKTVVQFHPGITAIIGPNGCGKSNVVDAVLWVLGEQRIKNLRGENNEDLIFNGSANKKPLGMTEVSATFSNRENDIFIGRRYFRAGESKYILNEKFCRNKDIQDKLFELGVGERNYFIFEQGSVEKMVSLKPTERRILIEEAAGIAQYLERKKETASKLVIAQQNLDTLDLVLTDKSNRLKDLRNQVAYARRYRGMKNEKNELLKATLRRRFDLFKEQFERHGENINKQMEGETLLVKDIADNEKDVLALEQQRWNLDRTLKANQQQLFDLSNRILNGQKEGEKSQQRQEFLQQRIKELEKLIRGSGEETAELDKNSAALQAEIALLTAQLEEERRQFAAMNEACAGLDGQRQELERRDAEFKKALFALQSDHAAAANNLAQLEKTQQRLDQEINGKQHLLTELEKQVQQQDTAPLSGEIEQLGVEHARAVEALTGRRQELEKLNADYDLYAAEARRLRGELENLHRMKERYEQLRRKLEGGNAAAAVPAQRLQELIRADKRHLRLLENFYFEEIDAPLAADAASAVALAAPKVLLKRFPAAAIPEAVSREPGYVGRVKDLFKLETPEWMDGLTDGVVVDTLANGLRIFFTHGVDVVTQAAEVISRRGLLFRSRERGILEVVDEIKEIDRKLETAAREQADAETRRRQADEARTARRGELETLNREAARCNERLIALRTRLETQQKNQEISRNRGQLTRREIDDLQAERAKMNAELERLTARRRELEETLAAQTTRRENLQQESESLRQQMAENERKRLERQNSLNLLAEKLDSRGRSVKELTNQRSKRINQSHFAESEITAHRKEIAAIDERLGQGKTEITAWEKEKNTLQKNVQGQEGDLTGVNAKLKELSTALNERRQKLETLRESRMEDEIRLAAVKKDLYQLEEISGRELNMELKEITADPEKVSADPAVLENELNDLTMKLDRMRESDHLNFSAESEFEILDKDYQNMLAQKEDIISSIQNMNAAIEKIDSESKESFHKAFSVIRDNFLTNFKILFEGGDAALTLTDAENVLESGLEIHAQPPGKRLQSLRLLSGGEKTLTSLAFLFALFQYKPSPFCVFDEVDASLDEANIQRFLKFLHKLKQNTQFLIITHNFKTMEEADFIYGISMDEPGISKMYSMKMT